MSALVEQHAGLREPDFLAIENWVGAEPLKPEEEGGVVTAERPRAQIVRSTKQIYSGRANRLVVRHHLGRIVAVIAIVSPGNKDSRAALRDFLQQLTPDGPAAVRSQPAPMNSSLASTARNLTGAERTSVHR